MTAANDWEYWIRVLPLPMMTSSPPWPSKLLKVPSEPALVLVPLNPGGIVGVGEVSAADAFDRQQGVGADGRIPVHDARGEMDGDPRRRVGIVVVDRHVVAAATVDQVVAAATFEGFEGSAWIVAAEQDVVVLRTDDGVDVDQGIVADIGDVARGRAVSGAGGEVDRDAGGGVEVGDAGEYLSGGIDRADDGVVAAAALEFVEPDGPAGSPEDPVNPAALKVSAKLLPVTSSIETRVSLPILATSPAAMPCAVPAVRSIATPAAASA